MPDLLRLYVVCLMFFLLQRNYNNQTQSQNGHNSCVDEALLSGRGVRGRLKSAQNVSG